MLVIVIEHFSQKWTVTEDGLTAKTGLTIKVFLGESAQH